MTLAGFRALGVSHELLPLALNLVLAFALLALLESLLTKALGRRRPVLACLALIILSAPLGLLVFSGMEHLLHTTLTVLFLWRAAIVLAEDTPRALDVALLGAAVAAARFEGLFAVAIVAALFAMRRRFRQAALVSLLGIAPVALYGMVSLAGGSLILPNSVIAKGGRPDGFSIAALLGFAFRWLATLVRAPQLGAPFALALGLLVVQLRAKRFSAPVVFNLCFVGTALLHAQFARMGGFYRYEAYLLVLGIVAIAWSLAERTNFQQLRRPAILTVLLVLTALPLGIRAWVVGTKTPRAMVNIHDQQVQMGRFLGRYYAGESVAANDIGAVAWYGRVKLLDLVGLASVDVIRAKMAGAYDTAAIDRLATARGVRVAIVFDAWFGGDARPLPAHWTCVGNWRIPDNVICGDDTIAFYGLGPQEAAALADHLREWSALLPPGVIESGPYLSPR